MLGMPKDSKVYAVGLHLFLETKKNVSSMLLHTYILNNFIYKYGIGI